MSVQLAKKYFEEHPQEFEAGMRRVERYREARAKGWMHSFRRRAQPEEYCLYCGISISLMVGGDYPFCREGWIGDELYGVRPDIEKTIRDEEVAYLAKLTKWEERLPKMVPDPSKLGGGDLARLHHTHGIEPDLIEALCGYSYAEAVHEEYQQVFNQHKQTGKAGVFKGGEVKE